MKLNLDPLPRLRQKAEAMALLYYSQRTADTLHLNVAYARKKEVARTVKDGGQPSQAFLIEANLRDITVQELADIVLSKPDISDEFEQQRQQVKARLAQAKTIEEIKSIVKAAGLGDLDGR